jgi:hypothetical protein
MTRTIALLILLSTATTIYSKPFIVKLGPNLNSDIVDHKLGRLTYPSYEINFEYIVGKHFSASLGYNYAITKVKEIYYESANFESYTQWTDYNHAFIPEFRYYLKDFNEGVFLQCGLPFTHSVEKRSWSGINGQGSFIPAAYNTLTLFGGLGIIYHFNKNLGIEMNCNISPSADLLGEVDYGTSGFVKTGLRFLYTFD